MPSFSVVLFRKQCLEQLLVGFSCAILSVE